MKSHLFHAILPDSAANMQQSSVKEGGNKAYWLQDCAAAGMDIAWLWQIVMSARKALHNLVACFVLHDRRADLMFLECKLIYFYINNKKPIN